MKKLDWRIWMKDKKVCEYWLNNYLKKSMVKKTRNESGLYLRKARHNLNFGNWLFENHDRINEELGDNYYDWLVGIYYYAIYHSALALVSRHGFASKSHFATLCFLIYHHYHLQNELSDDDVFLIVNSLNKEDIETLGDSKELRERASYDVHELFEKKLALQARENAAEFSNKIRTMIEEWG